MAENIKEYIDIAGLTHYDEKSKQRMESADDNVLKQAKEYGDLKVNELAEGQVKTNKEAIEKLNGEDNIEGSVKAQIKAAKEELENKITSGKYDDTSLKADIVANASAIEILNGTGVGSVDKKVADAVAAIIAEAPDSFDTLKEISDWIINHNSDAATMNSDIQENKANIDKLVKLVGSLPEGEPSKTIIEYIDSKVASVDFSTAISEAKQEAINAANTAIQALSAGQVTTNTNNINALETRVSALEEVEFTAISNEQIDSLFE